MWWKAVLVGAILAISSVAVAHAMDVDDVIGMLRAGIGEDVVLKALDASGSTLDLTSDDLVDLKDAGASDSFLDELLNREQQAPSYPSSSNYYYYPFGTVYDPFDYYFAYYPYYYAYMAPFSFSLNWWYYGGPYHHCWWQPGHGYRVHYYSSHWGTRSIWDRGFVNTRYHIPSYAPAGKEGPRIAFGRPGTGRTGGMVWQRSRPSGAWGRSGYGTRRYEQAPARTGGRTSMWGRSGGSYSAPPPPQRNTETRREAPARAPAPSAPPRHVWSR